MSIFKKNIGKNIKALRKSIGLSQNDISKELNKHVNTISSIEKSEKFGRTFIEYLELLNSKGVDLKKLFDDD